MSVGENETTFSDEIAAEQGEGLFDSAVVATPSDDTMQWRAHLMQLVNWGGFSGLTRVPLGGDATMISGGSGAGKSTILDAYTALMMTSDTKFNGASNDAVAGRARSAGQRNLLSYLRGAVDVVDDPRTGRPVEKLLRGKGADTWGAVAMTFVNDQGGQFTALRTYYVPRRATRSGEVQMQLTTFEGPLALENAELAVAERFHANTLKKLFPGIRVHRTYAEFAAVLHARLGIGANGDGAKALRLLARIQAGNQVRSVDELYKEMVLERPATYAAADRAVEHFDDLDAAYTAMRTEERKLELLGPIVDLNERKQQARRRRHALDSYGVTSEGDTPLRLWLYRTHLRLLEKSLAGNKADREHTAETLASCVGTERALEVDVENAKAAHRAAGGATLESLAASIAQEEAVLEERRRRRTEVEQRVLPLLESGTGSADRFAAAFADAEAFASLQADASAWLDALPAEQARLKGVRDEVRDRLYPVKQRQSDVRRERAALENTGGRVPARMHELREEVAAASGLGVDELPFVAELIDVAPEDVRWRNAVETVLGGAARLMLVPEEKLDQFSAAIDGLRLRGRLTFEGVPLNMSEQGQGDPARIAGKLIHKDSPFTGWVQWFVRSPERNALCVETADDLRGDGFRVTLAGQTRNGARGAHGRNDIRNIIGFSNEEAVAEADAELEAIEKELQEIDAAVAAVERSERVLQQRRTAYEALVLVRFDDIDTDGSQRRVDELEQRRADILDADDELKVLEAQIAELSARLEEARKERYGLEQTQRTLAAQHAELVDDEDTVKDLLEEVENRGKVTLDEDQAATLAEEFTAAVAPGDPDALDRFQENSQRLAQRLSAAVEEVDFEVRRVDEELAQIFKLYKMQWDSPNLGASPEAYSDFAAILDEIRGTGLAARRGEWRRRLTEWSGQDLVPLVGAMASSVEEIEDRLEPINQILRRIEFGASGDRLRIRLRRLSPVHLTTFMKDLRHLAAEAPTDLAEADLEKRFMDLRRFMNQLRKPSATLEGTSDRDRLLDVRRHVEISAERYDHGTGEVTATYRTLGEKSGGESQELVAFIVGSALRFRLGDEARSRPRFAPVFLDEGFVKADSEFAGRAVRAWKELGFQLVIGVPLDKVTGLEPHMDELLAITKNATTHQSWITPIMDAVRRAERDRVDSA
ncbi:ATP-binding protein [Nocardioides yefusunii]|uniref:ATP-binding protein n=1 Tax=Nocardioides yefusunii TaxID=2500546 RepID=A0ABW1QTH2_9ACTN|nr:SbcC/MukB-like Walker B domain-containing protein [Nocardioides yefusunii]